MLIPKSIFSPKVYLTWCYGFYHFSSFTATLIKRWCKGSGSGTSFTQILKAAERLGGRTGEERVIFRLSGLEGGGRNWHLDENWSITGKGCDGRVAELVTRFHSESINTEARCQ